MGTGHDLRLETYLRLAREHFRRAMDARERGEAAEARGALLRAAENLMLAARRSPPALKDRRLSLARELVAEAESLKAGKPAARSPASRAGPSQPARAQEGEAQEWMVFEKPDVRFEDVAGLEEVKREIRLKLIEPFTHPELAETYQVNPGGGLLLYGPPGTGKTLIARAVAGEVEAAFFAIKPSEIMSQWVGVAEKNLAALFAAANDYPLSVIFMDEMEALAPRRRSSHSTVMQRVVPQLLAEMDGFRKRQNVILFIGATNEPWAIDSAILRPGRLDRLIYVPPPDESARRKILELNLKNVPLAGDVHLEEIAARTAGFSGADMAALARRVRERVFMAAIQNELPRAITMADFQAVLSEMRPSIPAADLRKFEQFAQGSR